MIPAKAHVMGGDVTPLSYDGPPMPTLSEADSKHLLAAHGVPVLDERTVTSVDEAARAAVEIGYPGRREAVRRGDRAQDRARARAARPR